MSGPNAGEVTFQIKTVASGVIESSQGFRLIIVPVLGGVLGRKQEKSFPSYQSNTFVSITVGDLEQGESYTFSATATNVFGDSTPAHSGPVFAGV